MVNDIGTGRIAEFTEYQDVVLRISTNRGSSPIVIVGNGELSTAEAIGLQILRMFDYLIESPVFNTAKEKAAI